METLFSSINYKDPIWISIAFLLGFLVRRIGLPPLVGFLSAGFILNALGAENSHFLYEMADLGVTLLLFTIGLKLRVKELAKAEIWAVTLIHTFCLTTFFTLWLLLFRNLGGPLFEGMSMSSAVIIGFAMSFSSTVFVVKVLEGRGDMIAHYGRLSIGVLVVQDIAAVIFLAASAKKVPSIWAALLIVTLIFGRRVLHKLLDNIDYGELLVLFGLTLALGGAALFEAVDLKGDLGALVFGVMMASHPKTEALARTLFSMKELFLIGFFLSIGMTGLPDLASFGVALVLLLGVIVKAAAFFHLFSKFKVRSRAAFTASVALSNFSEFGLIVAAVAVAAGWLPEIWLITVALLVSCSFVISAIINGRTDALYVRFRNHFVNYQHEQRLAGDENIDMQGYHLLVCGMGRVGRSAFDHIASQHDYSILGLDFDERAVTAHNAEGRDTIFGNFSSPDFWSRLNKETFDIEWIMLCSPNLHTNRTTAQMARKWGFTGFISASAKHREDEEALLEAGVDTVFNIYLEAGAGLAQHGLNIYADRQDGTDRIEANPQTEVQ